MKYVNKTNERIKVAIEGTNPTEWKTLYKGDTIEAKSSVFAKAYEGDGLVLAKGKSKEKPEEKSEKEPEEEKPEEKPEEKASEEKPEEKPKKK